MCESYECTIHDEGWNEGFTEGWNGCRKNALQIMRQAQSEIGVPQPGYPANIANAYKILNKAQRDIDIAK